jgi:predicted nucleic acid-binding Zn ribbon protein
MKISSLSCVLLVGKNKNVCSHADALLFGRERKRSRVFSTLLSVSFVRVLLFVVSSLLSSSFTSSQQKKEYSSSADFEC